MSRVIKIASVIAAFCAFITGIWWLFYWLWNAIAAGVFGAPELTFWQAVGLLVLVGLLTSGIGAASKSKRGDK